MGNDLITQNQISEINTFLEAVIKLFKTKELAKGVYACDKDDNVTTYHNKDAYAFCTMGAIKHIAFCDGDLKTNLKVVALLNNKLGVHITTFNDLTTTTKEDVIKLLESVKTSE